MNIEQEKNSKNLQLNDSVFFLFSEVTIIPTYDTDVLGYWVAENEELLTELKIDLAPSASRCTINLQVCSFLTSVIKNVDMMLF